MSPEDAQHRLLQLLDERVFEPALQVWSESYPADKRAELAQVQQATHKMRERFHGFRSAEEIYRMFHDELSSGAAHAMHRKLRDLNLPTIADIRIEFERTARELGVGVA